MAISTTKSVYTLAELPDLLHQLEHASVPAKEIERRRKIFAEVDRIREAMEPISADIKDWIRLERGE